MKKNFLFGLIGAGALMFSAGVGYSAWTIVANDAKQDVTGPTLNADTTVNDNRITIDSISAWKDDSIYFGPSSKGLTSGKTPWLTADPNDSEDLVASYSLVVKSSAKTAPKVSATFDETDDNKVYESIRDTDAEKGAVGAIPKPSVDSGVRDGTDSTKYTFTVTIEFTWGKLFGSINPYAYYNNQDYTPSLADEAEKNILMLKSLNTAKFKLSLTVSAK